MMLENSSSVEEGVMRALQQLLAVRETSRGYPDLDPLLFTLCGSNGKALVRIGGTNDVPYTQSWDDNLSMWEMTWLHYDWKA